MKLCILDKDGTLTTPISGAKFPKNPQDQQLLPGVRELIDRLRADGWSLAIASNQGGCDIFECTADKLADGMIWHNPIGIDSIFKIERTFNRAEDRKMSVYYRHAVNPGHNESNQILDYDFKCLASYKTIESAIEEVQFAADLCGITDVIFCPVMDGSSAIELFKREGIWRNNLDSLDECNPARDGNYRKPGVGMLCRIAMSGYYRRASDRTVMIGDRPDDRGAAEAAGFEFFDAEDCRTGKVAIK